MWLSLAFELHLSLLLSKQAIRFLVKNRTSSTLQYIAMSENDLYGDLEEIEQSVEIVKLKEKIQALTQQNQQLQVTNTELSDQLAILVQDRNHLEENTKAIYNTALREIDRKDKIIENLQKEIARVKK